ncbi:hypothetical protein [Curtobacterium sp. CFBP9011]|uniref:hypothetical protein n=1 Tax=Curtobacterium sp. CFBP9011 TaxID=3096530 RepID=UPI002A6AD93E|nr:hypothetical protein [Curtobacterium sp. CFBP9011]MDY1005710.1 hypothetical protein [Curtobacterium sp. CFBP9011]
MSAALGRPAIRRQHSGPSSSYKPADLRVDDPRMVTGITPETASAAVAVVRARAGDDTKQVLDMLGLAVAS